MGGPFLFPIVKFLEPFLGLCLSVGFHAPSRRALMSASQARQTPHPYANRSRFQAASNPGASIYVQLLPRFAASDCRTGNCSAEGAVHLAHREPVAALWFLCKPGCE